MWDEQNRKLDAVRRQANAPGGTERIEKQHRSGKLTARERIDLLLDPESFTEVASSMMSDQGASLSLGARQYRGDGVVTGWGKIDGRFVCVAAEDFTVVGGTLGRIHAQKIARIQDKALQMHVPIIFINDSGGARIDEGIHSLSGYGEVFTRHIRSSGVIPQISVILGPCSGGACYSPALCDFIFAVQDISKMFITGPAVVESVLGSRPSMEELGGALMHSEKSGCLHALYKDEASCLAGVRKLLSYLPSCNQEKAARSTHVYEPAQVDWKSVVPDQERHVYDMHHVIKGLMDQGEELFEIQKHFAKNVIVGFSRLNGSVTGIVANQPLWLGGAIDCDASDKIARFVRFCDCFQIPVLTLVDVPAFLPGVDQEQKGIIRHGAKIIYAYAEASIPKITVLVRKAFGGAYIAMNSKGIGADYVYSWPIAQIAVMGAEGAVEILYRHELEQAEDRQAVLDARKAEYEERFMNPDIARDSGYIDEVIRPEETRDILIRSFSFLENKERMDPSTGKRHGNIPL